MSNEHLYEVDLEWNHNRKGTLSSSVLDQKIEVATPPQFKGGMEGIWSPEHLFVASVNSCLMTTFLAIAEFSKLDFISIKISGKGKLDKVEGRFMVSEITLNAIVEIPNDKDVQKAERILRKAKSSCLISNSIKSEVNFHPDIRVTVSA